MSHSRLAMIAETAPELAHGGKMKPSNADREARIQRILRAVEKELR